MNPQSSGLTFPENGKKHSVDYSVMSLHCHLCVRVTAHTLQTKVLEVSYTLKGIESVQIT